MTTIISTIPFRPTTLAEVDAMLRNHYPDTLPEYKERVDGTGRLRVTLRTYTNGICYFQVRVIHDELSSREVPV